MSDKEVMPDKVTKEYNIVDGSISGFSEEVLEFLEGCSSLPYFEKMHVFLQGNNLKIWFIVSKKDYEETKKYYLKCCDYNDEGHKLNVICYVLYDSQINYSLMPRPVVTLERKK